MLEMMTGSKFRRGYTWIAVSGRVMIKAEEAVHMVHMVHIVHMVYMMHMVYMVHMDSNERQSDDQRRGERCTQPLVHAVP